jgi:uncharacterized protein
MRSGIRILAFLLIVAGPLAPALAAPTFPALTGRVVDDAGILSPAAEADLTAKLAALEAKTTDQLVVATLPSLQGYDIADYGYQLGRQWGIGQAGKDNGALLIVAPNEREVRIEVGYGLEGDLTDAVTKLIIENAIIPKFRSGDMEGGVVAGVDDITKVLSGAAGEYQELARRQNETSAEDYEWLIPILFFALWATIVILAHLRRRKGRWVWVPGTAGGSSGGWSSRGGGWSSGGGGFSGGGGSFGGGGSSGRW